MHYQADAAVQQTRVAAADEVNNIVQQALQQQTCYGEVAANNASLLSDNDRLNAGIAGQHRTIADYEHRLRLANAAVADVGTAAANEQHKKRCVKLHNEQRGAQVQQKQFFFMQQQM